MLHTIIGFSIRNKLIVGLFIIALIGYGAYQITILPIDAVPDITNNQVQVITVAPALGASDIERLITFPIEQNCSNIPGLEEIRSFSRFGLSLVTIVFSDNVDMYWARQQVTERLVVAQQQIPNGVGSPELAPVTTGLGEIYQYALKAKPGYESKYDATELRTIQDWIVRRQLLGVKGIADVSSFGGRVKQYEIALYPSVLKAHNLTISEVFTALEKNNENTGGAYIEKASTVLYIRTEGLITGIDDVKNIVIRNLANGTPLLIKDVAEVRIGSATRYGAMNYNDEGEVAGGVVMMLKGENSSRVIKNVKEKIEQITLTLPEGVSIEPFLDRTKMVNSAIGTVTTNLLEGALIVIFVLVLFLGNIRAGMIVASVIPLSMLFAVIMMNFFGISGNLMSLGALDFGLIVDGAVIIVEAVMHSITHNKKFVSLLKISQHEMDETVHSSASRMMSSAVFGQIIILVVYLPIFTLEGIEGKMFKPMAQTVAFALLGAFLLSLTYIPMISATIMSRKKKSKPDFSDRMMAFIERQHEKILVKALRLPKLMMTTVLLLFVASLIVLATMGGEFIPTLEEGDFAVETRLLPGSNLNSMLEYTAKAAHILKSRFPEVVKVVTKIGSSEIPTDPMPMDAGDMIVVLKPKEEWTSAHTFPELSEKMSAALQDIPGMTTSFQYPVAMRFNELMSGAKQDIVCKIFGENLDTLAAYAKQVGSIASGIDGAENIYVEPVDGLPQLIINYKRDAMAQYGLNIQDMNTTINTALAGQSSGLVFEDEKRFDLVVRLAGESRQNLQDVQQLLISTPAGTQIPLYQVADVSIRESVNQIQREDAKRRIMVGFNVRGRDIQSVVQDIQQAIERRIKLPSGYHVSYGGAFENLVAAKQRLSIAVPVALLLIFVLLYFAFGSIKQGLLIYTAIPLSAIGGIFFLALRGLPFSISAGVGFIALFGVAVLNGIVLIAEFNRLKQAGATDTYSIVLAGTRHRLRPVLMTAYVASLGFLPMALSNGAGAEVQRPLATVVIGGLLVATFLTLFVLPALYIMFENIGRKKSGHDTISISTVLVLLFLFASSQLQAQQIQPTIQLQAAIDTALANNLLLRNEHLSAEYQQHLTATGVDIPQTTLSIEYGQINSAYKDSKFGISQSISFPTVYAKQHALQREAYNASLLAVEMKEAELKKHVSLLFYKLIYVREKQRILQQSDSLFEQFAVHTEARFMKGEANILEKTTATTQRGQIALQLQAIETDLRILQSHFQLLLNSTTLYLPSASSPKYNPSLRFDSRAMPHHPQLRYLQQQQQVSQMNTQLQESKLLPELFFGYSNQSIQGNGADNVVYGSSSRFSAVQLGIGIPLFYGAQKARINAAKVLELVWENSYKTAAQTMTVEYDSLSIQYQRQEQAVKYYEERALADANIIATTAQEQFTRGEINYLEWAMLINNATAIRSAYSDALWELNQTTIQLVYLTQR